MPIVCVDAVKENLPNVIEFVTKMLGENADGKFVFELELICEEVFVNICNYAYDQNIGKAEIEVSKFSDCIVVKFIDSGKNLIRLKLQSRTFTLRLRNEASAVWEFSWQRNFPTLFPIKDLTAKTFLQLQRISNLKNQLFITQNSKPNNTMFPKSDYNNPIVSILSRYWHYNGNVERLKLRIKFIGGTNYGNQ